MAVTLTVNPSDTVMVHNTDTMLSLTLTLTLTARCMSRWTQWTPHPLLNGGFLCHALRAKWQEVPQLSTAQRGHSSAVTFCAV